MFLEINMPRKTKTRASSKDTELANRYGDIGIPAVAAAARYQPNLKSPKPVRMKRSGNPDQEPETFSRGTSARR
jgi:hypothetical protein